MNKQIELSKEQNSEDKILIAKILDKIKFVESKNRFEETDFLDLRQQEIVKGILAKRKYEGYSFLGGYEDSERKIVVIYPENIDEKYIEEKILNQVLAVINITLPNELKNKYEHRNYLGGLMKLGIKREKVGDILVREDGADIIVKNEIANYINSNITGLTRFQKSKVCIKEINELIYVKKEKEYIKINVPSMRLDCIVGELAKCSRNEANKYLIEERVFVNFKEKIRASKTIKEGDYITIRGKGRFKINKILGQTKKGRLSVEIEK